MAYRQDAAALPTSWVGLALALWAKRAPIAPSRARREQQIADWLAEEPDIATRELVRRLQRAEHTRRISESTVAALRRVVEARLALVSPLADAATQQAER